MGQNKNFSLKSSLLKILQSFSFIFIGILLAFLLLEGTLRLMGWLQNSLREKANKPLSPEKKGEYRVLCLGESMTATGGKYSYPSQLETMLNNLNLGLKFKVINEGITGSNSSTILFKLDKNLNKYNPHMVVIMTGINDRGIIEYEEAAGIPEKGVLKNIKTYKLVKFLIKNITDKVGKKEADNYPKNPIKDPEDYNKYIKLGWKYSDQGMLDKAQEMFEKAIELNPKNDSAYTTLGWNLKESGDWKKAEETFQKAIEINPKNAFAYRGLGLVYEATKTPADSKAMFEKAVEVNPHGINGYIGLAHYYQFFGTPKEELAMLNKALEINPLNDNVLFRLGRYYWRNGDLKKTEEAFIKAIEIGKNEENKVFIELAELYRSQGKTKEAEEVMGKIAGASTVSKSNYQKLYEIVNSKGIQLVAVQYPLRDVNQLKNQLTNSSNIIFVDNEQIFEEAIEKDGHEKYFVDRFSGDFGHCTKEGNRIIAQNIVDTILKECRGCFGE